MIFYCFTRKVKRLGALSQVEVIDMPIGFKVELRQNHQLETSRQSQTFEVFSLFYAYQAEGKKL